MKSIALRRMAGATALMFLAYLMQVVLFAPIAGANHIPATGPLPTNCVDFQAGTTGAQSPPDHPGVSITLDAWHADGKGLDFTISGLAAGQEVDLSVKSATDVDEPGGYSNGSHSWSHERQNAISHVRFCVFVATTTSSSTSSTTSTSTTSTSTSTTTTQPAVTTTQPNVTTTQPVATTIPFDSVPEDEELEVLGTTITTAPAEVSADTLPFTGSGSDGAARLAFLALLAGGLLLFAARDPKFEEDTTDLGGWSTI